MPIEDKKNSKLCKNVYSPENLTVSWDHVYLSSRKINASKETRAQAEKFKDDEFKNLKKIHSKLKSNKFIFTGVKGIAPKKKSKKARPIALIPVEGRVVQRAILNVLQKQKKIKKYLKIPTSFGGIEDRGVPKAIESALNAISAGATYYIKSDIREFFTKIPVKKVLESIEKDLADKDFVSLVDRAVRLEVDVLSGYEEYAGYFDYEEFGTPQGCCLSPLIGNILLYDFDKKMNEGDIVCLRYLDDFIIFGPTEKAVNAAFKKAKTLVNEHGLSVYEPGPSVSKSKADKGKTESNFEYLGIEFDGDLRRPSSSNRNRLLEKIKEKIDESKGAIRESHAKDFKNFANLYDKSHLSTLSAIHNTIHGWGNQFYYCNDNAVMGSLDAEINSLVKDYSKFVSIETSKHIKRGKAGEKLARRVKGVQLLVDSKKKPFPTYHPPSSKQQ